MLRDLFRSKRHDQRRGYELLYSWVRTDPKTVRDIADSCIERANAMRWPESIADQLALEFFLGAAVGSVAGGSTLLANQIAWAAINIVAKRGIAGVRAIAADEDLAQ